MSLTSLLTPPPSPSQYIILPSTEISSNSIISLPSKSISNNIIDAPVIYSNNLSPKQTKKTTRISTKEGKILDQQAILEVLEKQKEKIRTQLSKKKEQLEKKKISALKLQLDKTQAKEPLVKQTLEAKLNLILLEIEKIETEMKKLDHQLNN